MAELLRVRNCANPRRRGDVIFVHGLNGNPREYWFPAGEPEKYWPAWLGEDLPDVGIWSLGYENAALKPRGFSLARHFLQAGFAMPLVDRADDVLLRLELEGIGERSLVFIGHSMGGLLIKQLLRTANDSTDAKRRAVLEQTRGVCFIATPHMGSDLAKLAHYFDALLGVNVSVEELRPHQPHLRNLNQWYRDFVTRDGNTIKTLSFFEMKPLPRVGLVVEQGDADPGVPNAGLHPLDDDHNSISKPTSKSSSLYRRILTFIDVDCLAPSSGSKRTGPETPGETGTAAGSRASLAPDVTHRSAPASDKLSNDVNSALHASQIVFSPPAKLDCDSLEIETSAIVEYLIGEATRHKLLFDIQFSSVSFLFNHFIILLTWDFSVAIIDRVLSRTQAYPLNDSWGRCLSLYRQATTLPYRTMMPGALLTEAEARRTIQAYSKLLNCTRAFLLLLREHNQQPVLVINDLSSLLEEAEFALINNNNPVAISRLEALLSTVHKLILRHAPQGPLMTRAQSPETGPPEIPAALESARKPTHTRSVLIIDDEPAWLDTLATLLAENDFDVTACGTTNDAMIKLIDHQFDVIITDLIMSRGGTMDGRELVIAAKKSNPNTKILVVTGYGMMSNMADLAEYGADAVIVKSDVNAPALLDLLR
jgi:CheY-like chemotaxis protein/pimeloyl-ACP methyl ester carboxylesterase